MKRKRVAILYDIETTLSNFCRVCPNHGTNKSQVKVCASCPIDYQLKEYGTELLGKPFAELTMNAWTDQESAVIKKWHGHKTVADIAVYLGRTQNATYARIKTMKNKGEL